MKKTLSDKLGRDHRRGIATTLAVVDEALCEVEQWAKGRELRSVLYRERNTLSEKQRAALLSEVAQMRRLLRGLRDILGLDGNTQNVAQAIQARCSVLRQYVIELEPKRLSRYGPLSPAVAEHLEPLVSALVAHIDGASDALSSSRE